MEIVQSRINELAAQQHALAMFEKSPVSKPHVPNIPNFSAAT